MIYLAIALVIIAPGEIHRSPGTLTLTPWWSVVCERWLANRFNPPAKPTPKPKVQLEAEEAA